MGEDMIPPHAGCWLEPPEKWAFRPLFFVLEHEIGTRALGRGLVGRHEGLEIVRWVVVMWRHLASPNQMRLSLSRDTTRDKRGAEQIYRDIPEELRELIEPVVLEHECELVDIDVARNRGQGLLRVTVDSSASDGRVPIENCVAISREVETLLDAADTMPGAYQLEVSSPGLDRLLGREKDFLAAVGLTVKLRTRRPIEGRKRFRGRLLSAEVEPGAPEIEVKLEVDGVDVSIPFDEIEKANSIYEFSSTDFGKGSEEKTSEGKTAKKKWAPKTKHQPKKNAKPSG